ncbi:MAG: hypothetical protein HQ562_03420 [Candidatus Marinimicrobia bacterium]|nr:hypothetical protein [Candidatus Neomarinimicrobiota bacterium]
MLYDKIVVGEGSSSLIGYEDRCDQRFVLIFAFNNTLEIIRLFRNAIDKGQKPTFKVKGDCVWDRSDPIAIYFLNCCLVDESQEMVETLNAGSIPVESIMDLPGGPWE